MLNLRTQYREKSLDSFAGRLGQRNESVTLKAMPYFLQEFREARVAALQ